MPGATAHGYPYPLGTDRVMDGDDAIHALADKIETNLIGGVATGQAVAVLPATANQPTPVTVTFPAGRFSAPPWVICTPATNAPNVMAATVYTVTATSVILYGNRNNTAGGTFSLGITWIACQP